MNNSSIGPGDRFRHSAIVMFSNDLKVVMPLGNAPEAMDLVDDTIDTSVSVHKPNPPMELTGIIWQSLASYLSMGA